MSPMPPNFSPSQNTPYTAQPDFSLRHQPSE